MNSVLMNVTTAVLDATYYYFVCKGIGIQY